MARDGVASYILAGGESSRMGRDKALIEFGGTPLILHIAAIVEPLTGLPTVVGTPERYASLNLKAIADDAPGLGPLGGISTALRESQSMWNVMLGCDLPFLTTAWLRYLADRAQRSNADVVLPHSEAGAEPLCAVYRKSCGASIMAALARGVRKVRDGLAGLSIDPVTPDECKPFNAEGLLFKNLNSSRDIGEISAALEKKYGRVAAP